MADRAELDPEHDIMVSWLPMFHDMGMVGFYTTPMAWGIELVKVTPVDFLTAPLLWAKLISDHRGTITAAPNFAYALLGRRLGRRRLGRRVRPVDAAHRAQRRGADRREGGARVRQGRGAVPDAGRVRVPGVRHGGGHARHLLRQPDDRAAARLPRRRRARGGQPRGAGVAGRRAGVAAHVRDPRTAAGRLRRADRGGPVRGRAGRTGGRRDPGPRRLRDAGLPDGRRARSRRRTPTGGSRPATSGTSSTARSSSAAAPRT